MKNIIMLRSIAVFMSLVMLFSSCASTTMIQTTTDGAHVFIDGERAGKTPYQHRDMKIVGSTTTVRFEKEGFETLNTSFQRNEEVDVGAVIGGIFFLFPFLWTMKYKPYHNYEMKRMDSTASSETEKEIEPDIK